MKLLNSSNINTGIVVKLDGKIFQIVESIDVPKKGGTANLELLEGDKVLWKGIVPTTSVEIDPDTSTVWYRGLKLPSLITKKESNVWLKLFFVIFAIITLLYISKRLLYLL